MDILCEITRTCDPSVPDSSTLTSKQTISRLARSTCCQRPNPRSAWAVRFSRTRHSSEWRVLETCVSPRSASTRRDEPFKSTAAVHDVSTRSAHKAAL